MFQPQLNNFLRLTGAALWIGLSTELFWAFIVLLLGIFYIWGFTTGVLSLERTYAFKNLKLTKLVFNSLSIISVPLTFAIFVGLAICSGGSLLVALLLGLVVAPLGYLLFQIPISFVKFLCQLSYPRTPPLHFFTCDESVAQRFIPPLLSPPRFCLAGREAL